MIKAVAAIFVATALGTVPHGRVDEVRVGLFRLAPPKQLQISSAAPWQAAAGSRSVAIASGSNVRVSCRQGRVLLEDRGRFILAGPRLELTSNAAWTLAARGTPARRYRGRLALIEQANALLPILTLPLEAYVEATTGDEMPADWPRSALTAQALASRTFAAADQGRHADEGFDFCDLTHCQLFRGLASQDQRVAAACATTRGKVLAYHGKPIQALWHSTCGGERVANDVIFGGDPLPYLRGGPDRRPDGKAWCAASPWAKPWHTTLPLARLQAPLRDARILAANEQLKRVAVTDTDEAGVPLAIALEGSRGHTLTGYAFWLALGPHFGWSTLPAPRFTIRSHDEQLEFAGRGLGHLVGLCQWGARGRALAGESWQAIAAAYFPGTTVRPLPSAF